MATLTLRGHGAAVDGCAFAADGFRVVTGDREGGIKVWDFCAAREIRTIDAIRRGAVRFCRFSPDGAFIQAGFESGRGEIIWRWDAATGARTAFGPEDEKTVIHAAAPDAARLVLSREDGYVALWDDRAMRPIARLGQCGSYFHWMFSGDGFRFAASTDAQEVKIWDARTGAPIATLADTDFPFTFSPSGGLFAAMPISGAVRIWNFAEARSFLSQPSAERQPVRWNPRPGEFWDNDDSGPRIAAYSFSPDGRLVAAISRDGSLTLVDTRTGVQRASIRAQEQRLDNGCRFLPDGSRILTWGGTELKLWDAASGVLQAIFEAPTAGVGCADVSPDGLHLAAGCRDHSLRIWEVNRLQEASHRTILPGRVISCGFSPDGATLWLAAGATLLAWEAEELRERFRTKVHHYVLTEIQDWACFPDGRSIAVAADDEITLWDASTGRERRLRCPERIEEVALSPDGSRLVSGHSTEIRIWDVANGAVLAAYSLDGQELLGVAFSPDGKSILVDCAGSAWVFDSLTGAPRVSLPALPDSRAFWNADSRVVWIHTNLAGTDRLAPYPTNRSPFHLKRKLAVSPDARKWVRWEGARIELAGLSSGQPAVSLAGHEDTVWSCRFSPDSALLASVSHDQTVRLWDAAGGAAIDSYRGEPFCSCAWRPDGKALIVGGYHGGLHLLKLDGRKVTRARAI